MSAVQEQPAFSFMHARRGGTIEERFEAYHTANPSVLDAIIEVARDAKREYGYRHWSINGVFEVLRYSKKYRHLRARLKISQADGFKLNNDYRSFYSRLAEKVAPDLEGFFSKRKSEADN